MHGREPSVGPIAEGRLAQPARVVSLSPLAIRARRRSRLGRSARPPSDSIRSSSNAASSRISAERGLKTQLPSGFSVVPAPERVLRRGRSDYLRIE
jgi:hypothetical protein